MLIDEYLVKLGVVADVSSAKKYREQLASVGQTAVKVAGMITAAVGAVGAYFATAMNDLDDLGTLAQNTGTSVAFIQEMGYAAAQMGSSTEAARASIQTLSRAIGEVQNGVGRSVKTFEHFGISVKNADGSMRDMGDVIGQIQDKMRDMNAQQQTAFLSRLGIDASMRQVLSMTSDEFGKLVDQAREWGVHSDEQAEAASNITNRFKDLRFGLNQFRTTIGLALLPTLDRLIGGFKEWFSTNRLLVQDGLMRLFDAIRYVVQIGQSFNEFIERTVGWKAAILLFAGAWALLNTAMLANPVTWIIVGIAALLLLIDDLMTHMKGGDALFGAFWGPFLEYVREAWTYLKEFGEQFATLWKVAEPALLALSTVIGDTLVAGLKIALAAVELFFGTLLDLAKMVVAAVTLDMDGFVAAWTSGFTRIKDFAVAVFTAISDLISKTLGRAGAFVETLASGGGVANAFRAAARRVPPVDAVREAADAVGTARAGARTPAALGALPAPTAGSPTGSGAGVPATTAGAASAASVTQHVDINIQSTDPGEAGRAASRALQDTARRAVSTRAPTVVQ
jgi:hypothetical protein